MMIPNIAITPSSATKPNGLPNSSSAATTPIRPSGAVSTTMKVREKRLSWIISSVSTAMIISGICALIDVWPFMLSSAAPPISIRYPAGSVARTVASAASMSRVTPMLGASPRTSACTVTVGWRSRSQITPYSSVSRTWPIVPSGTGPCGVGIARPASFDGSMRSRFGARRSTSTSLSRSRYCVTV